MDKDRIRGSADQAKGAVKEGVGKMFGDTKLENEGKADKAAGKVESAVGGLKDTLRGNKREICRARNWAAHRGRPFSLANDTPTTKVREGSNVFMGGLGSESGMKAPHASPRASGKVRIRDPAYS
jgi:uncharacterized protein YjbJ (UPF0337 family)